MSNTIIVQEIPHTYGRIAWYVKTNGNGWAYCGRTTSTKVPAYKGIDIRVQERITDEEMRFIVERAKLHGHEVKGAYAVEITGGVASVKDSYGLSRMIDGTIFFAGYTLVECEEVANQAMQNEADIYDITGDLAIGPTMIKDLVNRIRELEAELGSQNTETETPPASA